MTFTAKDVQALRQLTGAGMMDSKKALVESGGDRDAAAKWLREHGLAASSGRTDRENSQGAVSISKFDGAAAIVELKCETDFVAKSDSFVNLAGEIAERVARSGEQGAESLKDQVDELKITLRENIEVGRVVYFESREGASIGDYLHIQNDRGVNAVLVEVTGGSDEMAHELALHIASSRPAYLSRDEVPEDVVAEKRTEFENLSRNEGKPDAAIPKIVEGRLSGYFKDSCLMEQPYVKDEKVTVAQFIGSATVTRFAQVVVGT